MSSLAKRLIAAALALIAAGFPCPPFLEARSGSDTALGALVPRTDGFTVGAGATHAFRAGLANAPGDLSITRFPVRLSYNLPGGPQGFLSLNAVYEYADYDWSELDAFSSVHRVALSGVGLHRVGDSDWGLFGFGQVAWAAEQRVSTFGRALSGTAIAGPSYSFNRNLSVVAGALGSIRPERDPRFLPAAALNWRINDQWLLRTLNGALLSWTPAGQDRYQFDLSAEYRTRGFRIRSLPAAPDTSRPAVEEKEIAAGAGASIRLTDRLILQAFAEYLFEREWEFRADKRQVRTAEADNTVQAGFRLDYLF
jgi:hypothetical protein